jgi:hypothetical protein
MGGGIAALTIAASNVEATLLDQEFIPAITGGWLESSWRLYGADLKKQAIGNCQVTTSSKMVGLNNSYRAIRHRRISMTNNYGILWIQLISQNLWNSHNENNE